MVNLGGGAVVGFVLVVSRVRAERRAESGERKSQNLPFFGVVVGIQKHGTTHGVLDDFFFFWTFHFSFLFSSPTEHSTKQCAHVLLVALPGLTRLD